MRKSILHFSGLLLFTISTVTQDGTVKALVSRVSDVSLQANLNKMASSAMEGRMAASKGDDLAIQYIAHWFNAHHLAKPYPSPNPYLQSVPLVAVDYRKSSLAAGDKPHELDKDWIYFLLDKAGTAQNAEVVFVGYGLSLPAYDDLKDVDIEGKLVLFKSGVPANASGKPLIEKSQIPGLAAHLNAILGKKPLGMLMFVDDSISEIAEANKDFSAFYPYQDMHTPGFPTMVGGIISKDIANNLVGGRIDSIYHIISMSRNPHSFNTHKRMTLSIVENVEHRQSSNIIGIIDGTDTTLACIVITAHHDHEGIVNGKTYYGADDNGSGIAALLEITKVLGDAAANGTRPKRTMIFISTAAEEQGLIGSKYYAAHPVLPLTKTFCSVNIDMLGRVDSLYSGKRPDSNYVYTIYKNLRGEKLKGINDACCQMKLDTFYNPKSGNPSAYGLIARSDNFPFLKENIPSIWFFGGFHYDYHQPTDTPDKIDLPLLKRRTQLVLATLWQLANSDSP